MTAAVVNQSLFRTLTKLGAQPDEALDAASGFVIPAQIENLATKDGLGLLRSDIKRTEDTLRTEFRADLKVLEGRIDTKLNKLQTRGVIIIGGLVLVLNQLLPPGKIGAIVMEAFRHLAG